MCFLIFFVVFCFSSEILENVGTTLEKNLQISNFFSSEILEFFWNLDCGDFSTLEKDLQISKMVVFLKIFGFFLKAPL